MSRKRKAGVIFGPDGKPLDLQKMARERLEAAESQKPKQPQVVVPFELGGLGNNFLQRYLWHPSGMYGVYGITTSDSTNGQSPRRGLADRVADDVGALTADFEGVGGAELPKPEPDLSTYRDALEHAIANCRHNEVESTMYAKGEYQCQDCGKYLSRADMRKRSGGGFGWYG